MLPRDYSGTYPKTLCICVCECGKTTKVHASSLTSGLTRSCGCLRKTRRNHPMCDTKIFALWTSLLNRVQKMSREIPADKILTPRWMDFELFMQDVGEPPTPDRFYKFSRIDKSACFKPGNVRWVAHKNRNLPDVDIPNKLEENKTYVTIGELVDALATHLKINNPS